MAYPTGVEFKMVRGPTGAQPIHEASSTKMHELGTIIWARDVNYGEGEFIYLIGAASTAQGDVVTYNSKTGATTRTAAGSVQGPVGVAASACDATTKYGWYQISGSAPWKAATAAANADVYLASTAAQVDDLIAGGNKLEGAAFKAATSGGYATVQFNRPGVSGDNSETRLNVIDGLVVYATLSAAAEAGNAIAVTGQVRTLDGEAYSAAIEVVVRTLAVTADKGDISVTTGTSRKIVNPATGENVCWLTTTAAGAFAVSVANDQAELTNLSVTPGGDGGMSGLTTHLSLDFTS